MLERGGQDRANPHLFAPCLGSLGQLILSLGDC